MNMKEVKGNLYEDIKKSFVQAIIDNEQGYNSVPDILSSVYTHLDEPIIEINSQHFTVKECLEVFIKDIHKNWDNSDLGLSINLFIDIFSRFIINTVLDKLHYKDKNDKKEPIKQLLMVEDGSVDVDNLEEIIKDCSDTKVVVYRQGAPTPYILPLKE